MKSQTLLFTQKLSQDLVFVMINNYKDAGYGYNNHACIFICIPKLLGN